MSISMAANLILNGVSVKAPKSLSVAVQDIDGQSTRTAAGTMTRDRITVKRKLECEWGPLSDAQIAAIYNAISPVFVPISYPDPQQGQVTKTFYAGDRSSPVYSFNDRFKAYMWQGLSVNFVEQ